MKAIKVEFDLYCSWNDTPPIYRIYCDDDLLTERTYFWRNDENYIRENLVINVAAGHHKIRVENLFPDLGRFDIKNIKIDGNTSDRLDFDVV